LSDIVISGKIRKCIISGHHRYFLDSPRGKELYDIFIIRENLERELAVYEAVCKMMPTIITKNTQTIISTGYITGLQMNVT
jgi:hypothetical protein